MKRTVAMLMAIVLSAPAWSGCDENVAAPKQRPAAAPAAGQTKTPVVKAPVAKAADQPAVVKTAAAAEVKTAVAAEVKAVAAAETPKPRKRGVATVEVNRPKSFPHRIWAACDFEAQAPTYGWFGGEEKKNIPAYPGNATARKGTPYSNNAAMTGMNPVPGPCMGEVNYMYCRYFLKGTDQARFQHFSLSVSDNNNILVSGLTQDKWSELTLNFTRDARRNDGSAEAFQKGERMDDLKVFVGAKDDGKQYELVLDDVIFFDNDPNIPAEKEPFPHRVYYTAGFDTGVDPKSQPKFFPGEFKVTNSGPAGGYWSYLEAVPTADKKGEHVLVKPAPARPVGPKTKLRVRTYVEGAQEIKLVVRDATANADVTATIKPEKEKAWAFQYVDLSAAAKGDALKSGNQIESIDFLVPAGAKLFVDEVTLFEPGEPVKGDQPALP